MTAIFTAVGAWLSRRLAVAGLSTIASLAFLGPLAPILTGIANAIGATITAIFEILAALSKSAEGRVVLALAALGLGFLFLRFHYMEEGKAMVHPRTIEKVVHAPCARRK
jgi:hypothetical protein